LLREFAMLDLLYTGRHLVLDSALPADEVTRLLQREITASPRKWGENRPQLFEGTFENGRFEMARLVRGRNSFRPMMTGTVSPGQTGTRLNVRLQLHPFVLVVAVVFALVAGTIASIAAPDIPAPGGSLLARLLAMAVVMVIVAGLGSIEARISTKILANLVAARVHRSRHVSERAVARHR
jgi:hypothetical protein